MNKNTKISRILGHAEVLRFMRGCLVAGIVFAAYMGSGLLLRYEFGLSEVPAAFVAFFIAAPISYFGHGLYTFNAVAFDAANVVRFSGSLLLTIAISWLVMHVGVRQIGMPYWAGLLTITVVVPIINYLLMRLYVFARTIKPASGL